MKQLTNPNTFFVNRLNSVYMKIHATEPHLLKELGEYFTFYAPNYKFHPLFRMKRWDGKIRLFNVRKQELYLGLLSSFIHWADSQKYDVVPQVGQTWNDILKEPNWDVTDDDILDYVNGLEITAHGKPITLYEHQEQAIINCIRRGRLTLLSPTSSGKSLVLYALSRWYYDILDPDQKILLIVPTLGLIEQMFSDFKDYSSKNGFDCNNEVYCIYGGQIRTGIQQRIIITTWQSIFKEPKQWFDKFGVVIGDECHKYKQSNSLVTIMKKMTGCQYRFGTTGTFDGTAINKLVAEGLFGEVFQPVTTKELMDLNLVSKLQIHFKKLEHPQEYRVKRDYFEEMDFLVSDKQRNDYITNLATSLSGNTLVLFQYVEKHGKPLFKQIQEKLKSTHRKVFYVSGETPAKERELIRGLTEQENDGIIVANYQTFSTGINIRSLQNIVLASPCKSRITILQSIGRQLRKYPTKVMAHLYDIVDDIRNDGYENYTYKHFQERMRIYNSEHFTHDIETISL